MENYENIKISNHCKQRYVERITGIVDSKEIKRYLATEEENVVENIHKMLHYGNIIYEGKNFEPHDSNIVKIVLNGTWLVFVGKDSNTAITMYKIDLGLGEEFNKSYVGQFLKSLEDIDLSYGETEDEVKESASEIDVEIEECNRKIEEHKEIIKQYEAREDGLRATKDSLNVYLRDIDLRRRDLIGKLICKKAM